MVQEDGLDNSVYTFFKIKIHDKPKYLFNMIPSGQIHYNTRNTDQVETSYSRTDIF